MKIGIPVEENNMDTRLDDRFGRAGYFAIVSLENGKIKDIEYVENIFKDESSGAGQKTAMLLSDKDVKKVIVPELGPKAKLALKELEIEAFKKGDMDNLEEALENLLENNLKIYPLVESGLRRA
ncbi:NifB/NifX family molybdenum-iron cluster-binding protein [Cetobacterium sp. SF1]|uniref:NifB/NifX family molybdenum-iron cluster-binding protein n=1 Tax=Cetobacterium sp. SF1 TaxID=3417654 RepID=UPI003CEE3F6B